MDILAARKKAAQQAMAARDSASAAGRSPVRTEVPDAFPAPDSREPVPTAGTVSSAASQSAYALHGKPVDAPSSPEVGPEPLLEMLAFLLGAEEYVVPVDQVREVLKPREITPVPRTPDYLLGVCSLRGAVLPVVDLARRLQHAPGLRDEKSRIIVTGTDADDRVGLLVDRVRSVVRFPASAVRPVPETVEQGVEFLRGIARRDQQLFILLDVEKATSVGRQKTHKKVLH